MNKEEFLSTLDRKLQLINESERRDIIDEYRTHIEMKVQDGKSEEEAIEDFGNIDELVDEILDAYKINTSRANQSFDRKFNSFMDNLYDGFKRFIGSFTSLEVDDVVRLIFEILVILIILSVLHLPFSFVGSLGGSLLRNIIPLGIGHLLGGIWKVVIELAYVVVFIVIIVNVVMKRINRYRNPNDFNSDSSVFDDFKDSFSFEQARHNMHAKNNRQSYTNHERKEREDFYEDEDIEDVQEEDISFEEQEERKQRTGYESREDRMRQKTYGTSRVEENVTSVFRVLMRIFYCLLLIPFIGIIVGLCCALGAMVVLSIQGFTLVGAYFLVVGGLFVTGAFLSLLHSVLWRKG
ncbi:MAG: DUF1700 domain-containing protein [Longicatena sp.]